MTEERNSNVSSEESSQTRQRRKRKWDQPAESLVSAGLAPSIGGTNSLGAISIQRHANAITQLLNMPKIQDELTIAREIVINDAEPSVRYKLTKRQTQEEIKKSAGAVVITRGKYYPPNAPADSEKPLYLHISAGAHLKDTAERILSVDRAASMVEEMLKQQAVGSAFPGLSNGTKSTHAISERVFLGFDPEPSLNIAARICGPSDQYINHIMNETGVNVILGGRGSGNIENPHVEEGPEPLHLLLSSNDSKSLENAKSLAENLLDTISIECGVSRVSSSKVYSSVPTPQQVYRAVPPPQHLLGGVPNSGSCAEVSTSSASVVTTLPPIVSPISPVFSQGTVTGHSLVDSIGHTHPLLSGGTSYSGYGGIYPQATPLQQVALVLRQSASPVSCAAAITPLVPKTEPKLSLCSNPVKDKRPPKKRKFQELPITSKSSAKSIQVPMPFQGSEVERPADLTARNVSSMPAPKKFVSTSNLMPPPPPRATFTSQSPQKFISANPSVKQQDKNNALNKVKSGFVSDTLVKLMEYGDDDDDQDENGDEAVSGDSGNMAARKPFWAL